jgi:hypothetical protein
MWRMHRQTQKRPKMMKHSAAAMLELITGELRHLTSSIEVKPVNETTPTPAAIGLQKLYRTYPYLQS